MGVIALIDGSTLNVINATAVTGGYGWTPFFTHSSLYAIQTNPTIPGVYIGGKNQFVRADKTCTWHYSNDTWPGGGNSDLPFVGRLTTRLVIPAVRG